EGTAILSCASRFGEDVVCSREFNLTTSTGTGLSVFTLGIPRFPVTTTSFNSAAVSSSRIVISDKLVIFIDWDLKPTALISSVSPVFTGSLKIPSGLVDVPFLEDLI